MNPAALATCKKSFNEMPLLKGRVKIESMANKNRYRIYIKSELNMEK
jgi:hypothetical protein